jgi:hypothetical protein
MRSPTKPASRNGLSLTRSGCPVVGHLSGIVVPGLLLRCACRIRRAARSTADSFPRLSVSRGGGFHRPQSVAVSVSGTPAGPPGLAPLQDLSILPVRYSTWFTCRKLAYATRTRPVTPLRRWLLSVEAGSPLPVHFVPRDSLFRGLMWRLFPGTCSIRSESNNFAYLTKSVTFH